MAVFDPIYDLTGGIRGVFEQGHNAGTDGTDFYYWDYTAGLYKYEVSSNTDSLVVNRDDMVSGYGNWNDRATKIASFGGAIYLGQLIGTSAPNPADRGGRVWKYTPSADTLSAVFQRDIGTYNNAFLYADNDHLFIHIAGTNSPAVNHEGWYSTDGTSWSQASYGSDPTRLFSTFTCYSDMRAGGIYFLSSNRLYKSNSNGIVSVVQNPYTLSSFTDFGVGQTTYFSDVGAMVFTTQPKYITVQWSAEASASAQGAVLKDLNMPETLLQNSTTTVYQWNGTNNFVAFDTLSVGAVISNGHFGWVWRANSGKVFLFSQRSTNDWWVWQRDEDLPATPGAWGGGGGFPEKPPSRKPADVDADGTFLYIALLIGGGVPALFKLSTTLTVDPTVVFNPGAGSDIGVQCGRYDANIVWVGGEFGGGDTLEKSEDAGDTFDIKDAGIFGYVRTFEVGMDSDDRVIIFDSVGNEIYETENSGNSWSLINSNTGFVVNVIKRLRFNLEEIVTGNNSGVVDNVDYSVNSGQNLEDLSFPVSQDVNSLAIG